MAALARALLVALIAGLVAGSGGDAAGQSAPQWERIEPGGRTACARGGRFAFWVRRADPSRVVIFFQGGGGCWDAATCAEGSSWFDDSVSLGDDPRYNAGGIFDFARADNPFRGWSFVFVPSCTGDVYMGDKDTTYARGLRVRHRGSINAQAALRTAFARFPSPRRVLVAGCSAGSVGAAFHVGRVIARYPRARVTLLGDSLAFPFSRPLDLTTWGAPSAFSMEPFLRRLARAHPRRTFARFNYASDDVQERFDVTGERTPFERRLRAAEARLKRLPNYRSYLACGGDHCVLPQHRFYTLRVAGVRVRDWAANLAAGRNVGCPTCRAG